MENLLGNLTAYLYIQQIQTYVSILLELCFWSRSNVIHFCFEYSCLPHLKMTLMRVNQNRTVVGYTTTTVSLKTLKCS